MSNAKRRNLSASVIMDKAIWNPEDKNVYEEKDHYHSNHNRYNLNVNTDQSPSERWRNSHL
ncbi:MAG: hypothetical protein GX314_05140 [Clostridiaceae bacterium]|nr:hypothetical protein [Clostridiaceae bacterium]